MWKLKLLLKIIWSQILGQTQHVGKAVGYRNIGHKNFILFIYCNFLFLITTYLTQNSIPLHERRKAFLFR